MPTKPTIWLRAESRPTEYRAPLSPRDAGTLVAAGVAVTVECSGQRVFPDAAYAGFGCRLAEPGSWSTAPGDALILGLKELPGAPGELRHRHAFFGHAFKCQPGAAALLARFQRGGGMLLDLEYLTDAEGERVAAFGHWAGFMGAALGVLALAGPLGSLAPFDCPALVDALRAAAPALAGCRSLVIGARGRSGRGAGSTMLRSSDTTFW
jgi:saccharopine dehydrogenase (NAD+, L-lysine-forming)